MDYLGTVLGAGLSTAFVMSVLDYFNLQPLVKAVVSLAASFLAVAAFNGFSWQTVPLMLGSAFLGLLLFSLVSQGEVPEKRNRSRIPRL